MKFISVKPQNTIYVAVFIWKVVGFMCSLLVAADVAKSGSAGSLFSSYFRKFQQHL